MLGSSGYVALVDTLIAKTRAWEEDRGISFIYDGVPLLAMLDEYTMLRHEREEEKRRFRVNCFKPLDTNLFVYVLLLVWCRLNRTWARRIALICICEITLTGLLWWTLQDQKKFHEQQSTDQETITNPRPNPSPARPVGTKKAVGPRANGGTNGTPSSRRLSLNQNGSRSMNKDGRRDSMRPMTPVKYDAISKEDSASHISVTEPVSSSPWE